MIGSHQVVLDRVHLAQIAFQVCLFFAAQFTKPRRSALATNLASKDITS